MIKHIVLWKLKDKNADREKALKLLRTFKERIDAIRDFELGINFSTLEIAYDISMTVTFMTKKDLNLYREHPDRIRMIELMKRMRKSRVVVDYEVEE